MGDKAYIGQFGTVDSANLLIDEILKPLKKAEGYLAIVGIIVGGKIVWSLVKNCFRAFDLFVIKQWVSGPNQDWNIRYGEWAVINGAAPGIGAEFAIQLAERGMNVILIIKSKDDLEFAKLMKQELSKYGVSVMTVVADFSNTELNGHLKTLEAWFRNKNVGVLVNNTIIGNFLRRHPIMHNIDVPREETATAQLRGFERLHAISYMSSLLAPTMALRQRGAVINVCPNEEVGPFYSIYNDPQRQFVCSFSKNLERKFSSSGLHILSLQPYRINSGETYDPKTKNFFQDPFVPPVKRYVKNALCLVGKTSNSTGYWAHGLQYALNSVTPVPVKILVSDVLQFWRRGRLTRK